MASSFSANSGSLLTLKVRDQVRLQAMFVPDPPHALFTDTRRLRHGARAPVGGVVWFLLRRFPNHFCICAGVMVGVGRGRGVFLQAGEAILEEPFTPSSSLLIADIISAAISKSCFPSAAKRMICARWTWRAGSGSCPLFQRLSCPA